MRPLRSGARTLGFLLLILLAVLPLTEVSLRVGERLVWVTGCTSCEFGLQILGSRLNQRLWKMFLGAGARDLRVLPGNLSTAPLLPPKGAWSAVDFLLPEAARARYPFTVHSDSFGFRGPEQKIPPRARSFRVLVLGSYQAFGHGVSDGETYSALLLERLKASPRFRLAGLSPVVWNAGMQSASIDRGLEVVSQKFEELQPHLVVLDYGMTDQVSRGMNPWLAPFSVLASRGSELFSWLDGLSRMNSTGPVGKLYLFNALVTRSMRKNLPENRAYWEQQTRQLLTYLSSKGVKILLLDQPVAGMEPEPYRKVVSGFPGADFLSVRESLEKVARESHSLPPDPPWMEEFPESFRAYYRKKVPFYFFLGSILHLNSRGHAEVARLLAAWIEAHSLSP